MRYGRLRKIDMGKKKETTRTKHVKKELKNAGLTKEEIRRLQGKK